MRGFTINGRSRTWLTVVLAGAALLLVPAAAPAPAGEPSGKRIEHIRVETGVAGKVGVFFKLSAAFAPKCFSLVGGDRKLVCDFIDTAITSDIGKLIDVESDLLFRIRIGRHFDPVRKTRIVLDLERTEDYAVDMLFVKGKSEFVLVIEAMKEQGEK